MLDQEKNTDPMFSLCTISPILSAPSSAGTASPSPKFTSVYSYSWKLDSILLGIPLHVSVRYWLVHLLHCCPQTLSTKSATLTATQNKHNDHSDLTQIQRNHTYQVHINRRSQLKAQDTTITITRQETRKMKNARRAFLLRNAVHWLMKDQLSTGFHARSQAAWLLFFFFFFFISKFSSV